MRDELERVRQDGDGSTAASVAADVPSPADADARRGGVAAAHAAEPNRLLRLLPVEEYGRLLLRLRSVRLPVKEVLVEPDQPIRDVYFLRHGVASVIYVDVDGNSVEVGTIGPEGFVGIPVLLGGGSTPYRSFVQVEAEAWRLGAEEFRALVDELPVFRRLLLRFTHYYTDQLSQSVACNRLHTLEERCARWLLMTHDRVESDAFEITHEFLALMLGVRRAGVTVAMGALQAHGIVRYSRGRVSVVDRAGLEEQSCACYRITRAAQAALIG